MAFKRVINAKANAVQRNGVNNKWNGSRKMLDLKGRRCEGETFCGCKKRKWIGGW